MGFLTLIGTGRGETDPFTVRKYIKFFFSVSGALSPRWAKKQATFAHLGETLVIFSPRLAKGNEDPNTFEEFLEPEEYIYHGHLFTTDRIFNSKDKLVDWAKQTAMKVNTYLIINQYKKLRTSNRRPYVTLACERGGAVRKNTKPIVDDKEEEVPIKRRGSYRTKKCGCLFKLKREQMATSETWQLSCSSCKTYGRAVATD
ncbi:hypothetical protein M9H77_24360 [Catharanthus roseus]|uniref:Uncharacterized protein n=1 Tax=Catharanthus roseus TaxID=4058 RepID=A0ACC0AVI2_CATRO|nr:hypothetical protein M9H77_24360 [Catharanthus roseus]